MKIKYYKKIFIPICILGIAFSLIYPFPIRANEIIIDGQISPTVILKKTIYVDDDAIDDSGDGLTESTAKKSIRAGIEAVDPSGEVIILPGEYRESIIIEKSLTLKGNSPEETFIIGDPAITINHDEVKVEKLNISKLHPEVEWQPVIYAKDIKNLEINNNVIHDGFLGIRLDGINHEILINENQFYNIEHRNIDITGAGENFEIVKNNIEGGRFGIMMLGYACNASDLNLGTVENTSNFIKIAFKDILIENNKINIAHENGLGIDVDTDPDQSMVVCGGDPSKRLPTGNSEVKILNNFVTSSDSGIQAVVILGGDTQPSEISRNTVNANSEDLTIFYGENVNVSDNSFTGSAHSFLGEALKNINFTSNTFKEKFIIGDIPGSEVDSFMASDIYLINPWNYENIAIHYSKLNSIQVEGEEGEKGVVDATSNWWGKTDSISIRQFISNKVNYWPFWLDEEMTKESQRMEVEENLPTFIKGVEKEFDVSTIANQDLNEMVRAYFVIPEGAYIEYLELLDGKYYALPNEYGPATGFPVRNATSTFKGTFNINGTYTTNIEFKRVSDGVVLGKKDIIATVVNPDLPSIISDVQPFTNGVEHEFTITTQNTGDYSVQWNNVDYEIILRNGKDQITSAKYLENNGQWLNLPYEISNNDIVSRYGPEQGFTFPSNMAATSTFKLAFASTTLGSYDLEITMKSGGNEIVSKTLILQVVDISKPIIELKGETILNVKINTEFIDPGATCYDNYETCAVTTSGTVKMDTKGAYILEYHAQDSAGNKADPLLRTINVVSHDVLLKTIQSAESLVLNAGGAYPESAKANLQTQIIIAKAISSTSSQEVVDEAERTLADAVKIFESTKIVPVIGGGGGGGGGMIIPMVFSSNNLFAGYENLRRENGISFVKLIFDGGNAVKMAISNSVNFEGVSQETYQPTKNWILPPGSGVKTVYVKFYDNFGNASGVIPVLVNDLVETRGTVLGEKISRLDDLVSKLKAGSTGKEVKELQTELQRLGFFSKSLRTTNYYGKHTAAAVKKYLDSKKSKIIQTSQLITELEQLVNTLKFGQRNENVRKLQLELKKLGFFPSKQPTTGYYGPITSQAVKNYLKSLDH